MHDQPTEPADPITVTVTLTVVPKDWADVRTGIAVVDPVADFRAWVAERVAYALDEQPLGQRTDVAAAVDGGDPWALVFAHRDAVTVFRHEQEIRP